MDLSKILLENKKGNYAIAKFAKSRTNLKPSRKKINKNDLNQIGYFLTLTIKNPLIGENYPPIGIPYKGNEKYFGKACLINLINNTTTILEQKKGDYILLKNLKSENSINNWEISADIHYMKKI